MLGYFGPLFLLAFAVTLLVCLIVVWILPRSLRIQSCVAFVLIPLGIASAGVLTAPTNAAPDFGGYLFTALVIAPVWLLMMALVLWAARNLHGHFRTERQHRAESLMSRDEIEDG